VDTFPQQRKKEKTNQKKNLKTTKHTKPGAQAQTQQDSREKKARERREERATKKHASTKNAQKASTKNAQKTNPPSSPCENSWRLFLVLSENDVGAFKRISLNTPSVTITTNSQEENHQKLQKGTRFSKDQNRKTAIKDQHQTNPRPRHTQVLRRVSVA